MIRPVRTTVMVNPDNATGNVIPGSHKDAKNGKMPVNSTAENVGEVIFADGHG